MIDLDMPPPCPECATPLEEARHVRPEDEGWTYRCPFRGCGWEIPNPQDHRVTWRIAPWTREAAAEIERLRGVVDPLRKLVGSESGGTYAELVQAIAERVPGIRTDLTVREAARRRLPLDGSDAQALEGAVQITERERDEAREAHVAALVHAQHAARREHDLANKNQALVLWAETAIEHLDRVERDLRAAWHHDAAAGVAELIAEGREVMRAALAKEGA